MKIRSARKAKGKGRGRLRSSATAFPAADRVEQFTWREVARDNPHGSVQLVFALGTVGEKVAGEVWYSEMHRGWVASLCAGLDLEQVGAVTVDREMAKAMRWAPFVGQRDGLDKLGPGFRQAANLSIRSAPYASSGVRPASALCGRPAL
jgi:hypothetical protein